MSRIYRYRVRRVPTMGQHMYWHIQELRGGHWIRIGIRDTKREAVAVCKTHIDWRRRRDESVDSEIAIVNADGEPWEPGR